MVDSKENYKLDLGVQGWNEEIYHIFFMFSQKVSLTKKQKNKKPTIPDLVDETGTTFFPFFFLASLLISYKPKWNDIKKVILVHRGHKVHKESYIHKYHFSEITTQVNSDFMCTDSFTEKWSASIIHCQAGKETKSTFNPFSL